MSPFLCKRCGGSMNGGGGISNSAGSTQSWTCSDCGAKFWMYHSDRKEPATQGWIFPVWLLEQRGSYAAIYGAYHTFDELRRGGRWHEIMDLQWRDADGNIDPLIGKDITEEHTAAPEYGSYRSYSVTPYVRRILTATDNRGADYRITPIELHESEVADRPVKVHVDTHVVIVQLESGKKIVNALALYPWLKNSLHSHQTDYQILPFSIYWPHMDELISISDMVRNQYKTNETLAAQVESISS